MKWAVFSDIHGNSRALKAVLESVEREEPDRIFCLGDLIGYGANPNEVIETIRDWGIPTIMGNYDEGVGFDLNDCGCAYRTVEERELGQISLEWTKRKVTSDNKKFLQSLNREMRLTLGPYKILLVHGSPRRINEYLHEDRPAHRLLPLLQRSGAQIVICGHTHIPYHRQIETYHLINTGSVGKPKDGSPLGHYILVKYREYLQVEIQRVEYDVIGEAQDILRAGLPEEFARQIKTGL